MFQNTVKRSRREVIIAIAGNCHEPFLRGMLELVMAATCPRQIPAVFLQYAHDLPNLHKPNIIPRMGRVNFTGEVTGDKSRPCTITPRNRRAAGQALRYGNYQRSWTAATEERRSLPASGQAPTGATKPEGRAVRGLRNKNAGHRPALQTVNYRLSTAGLKAGTTTVLQQLS